MDSLAAQIGEMFAIFAAVASPVGAGLAAGYRWLKPLICQWFADQHEIAVSVKRNSVALSVLWQMYSDLQQASVPFRRAILIVEDHASDAESTLRHCSELAVEYDLKLMRVPTMRQAYDEFSRACIVIFDLEVGDVGREELEEVVKRLSIHIPVILHSDLEPGPDEFQRVHAVVKKNDWDGLKTAITTAVKYLRLSGKAGW